MSEDSAPTPTALLDQNERSVEPTQHARPRAPRHGIAGWGSLISRLLGALAVVIVGAVHLQAYDGPYSAVPTIGVLFLVNFAAATTIGITLLLPLERIAGRWGGVGVVLVSVAGIGLAAGSLAMLIVAEHGTLFGFHEPGYDPQAISNSRIAEVVTVGLLTASLALRTLTTARPRW